MYYDRTVSQCLLDELRPNGAFGFLAQLPRTWHLTDLQLRAYPGKPACWATLYVGLTKVLDVHERGGIFRLVGKAAESAWDPVWENGHSADWFRNQPGVVAYVRGALGQVAERFTNEGAVQAMLCTRASQLFSVIDREAVVGFENTAARTATYRAEQAPLLGACKTDPAPPWFKPKPFGGELDLLAVDDDGRILVIEIKPASATGGIGWAPLQATFYTRLFRAWAGEAGDRCGQILQSMLHQRVALGLTRDPLRSMRTPVEFVPVVAIGGQPRSSKALPRLQRVQSALIDAGVGEAGLEVWIVEETVQRTRVPAVTSTTSP